MSSEREAGSTSVVSTGRNQHSPAQTLQQSDEIEGQLIHSGSFFFFTMFKS